jgi:hypothetical protein
MRKMKKLFTIMAFSCFCFSTAKSQTCDTTRFEESITGGWSAISYYIPSFFGPGYSGGYIAGSNSFDYTEKANYFDLSATSYAYIHGVIIKFLNANTYTAANLSKIVYFKVYNDVSGKPGSIIGTTQKTLGEIKTDVDAGNNTNINFASAIALPSSKKFYISVDVSNLVWLAGTKNSDSLSIAATADDQVLPATAWDYSITDSVWTRFSENWTNPNNESNELNVNLWIFPYVSTTSTSCGLLPVNLLSFTATRNNNDVTLKWEVSNEINMKGYSIEKADNNGNYKSIAFTPAGNNLKNQTYTVTDRNAFAASSTVQYRLKQVNADGSTVYSRIISLNHNASLTDVVFQNPITGILKLQVTLAASQKVSVRLYDMQGRLVTVQQAQNYNAGVNTIILSNTTHIKPGTYLLKLDAGNEQMIYKVVKQ